MIRTLPASLLKLRRDLPAPAKASQKFIFLASTFGVIAVLLAAYSSILSSGKPSDRETLHDIVAPASLPTPPRGDGPRLPGTILGPGARYADSSFYIHGLGSRCVDFGGQAFWKIGAPVVIFDCNNSSAQQVHVHEIDVSHDVLLQVQSQFCLGVRGGVVAIGQPLELQVCNGSPAQRFAFDGDAILMGKQTAGRVTREYVIEPAGDSTNAHTPLVVGTRDLTDAEYFRFRAVDGSNAPPTTGFVPVAIEKDLDRALKGGWGTVIEIDDRQSLTITGTTPKVIHSGVTLRGYRKYIDNGPEIVYAGSGNASPLFDIHEDHVRVTGLRMRGKDFNMPRFDAIIIQDGDDVIIDHLDSSYWTGTAVGVGGNDKSESPTCPVGFTQYPRPTPVRVVRNFVHHDEPGDGYGMGVGNGGFALFDGNVEYRNNHSIVSDPWGTSGYVAQDNFVLSESSGRGGCSDQDFDVHGSSHDSDHGSNWCDGLSGDYFDIGWNTFLSTSHKNFNQRGTPCRFTAFHDNVLVQSKSDAIATPVDGSCECAGAALSDPFPKRFVFYADAFGAPNPTNDLAVGDFDGDGIGDVFVGTGVTWWFSSGGQAEWRLLNRMPEHARELRFGDFDGDGRTDVIAVHGGRIDVSWGGASPWMPLATTSASISDLAVGDFDGDHHADIFVASGSEWKYASSGKTWTHFAYLPQRTNQLRFGDFTGDGKTDVLGVVGNRWMIVRGGGNGQWEPLGDALTSTVDGLVVADFDGNGRADVARKFGGIWQYAPDGWNGWVKLRDASPDQNIAALPVGRFDGDAKADVIVWDGLHFAIARGGREVVRGFSRQDMR